MSKFNSWLRALVAAALATCVSAFTLGSTLAFFPTAQDSPETHSSAVGLADEWCRLVA